MEVSPDLWKTFVEEAIRNPKAAASMSALFESDQKRLYHDRSHAQRSSGGPINYLAFEKGVMGNFYSTAFTETANSLNDQRDAWVEEMNASRTALVETAAGLAAGGPSAAVDTAKETGQELALGALTGWLARSLSYAPDDAPPDLLASIQGVESSQIKDEATWPGVMNDAAADMIQDGFPQRTVVPVTFNLQGETPRTYTGDPYGQDGKNTLHPPPPVYIQHRGGSDDFVKAIQDNQGVVDVQKMTPMQRDSYTRWLKDPAVAAKLNREAVWTEVIGQLAVA